MPRPPTHDLTDRELEVMQTFWDAAEATAAEARELLAESGRPLSYPTVANLVRGLAEKGYLAAINDARPFRYRPTRDRREVSGSMLGRLIDRVFGGSREELLVRLMEREQPSPRERELLEEFLKEAGQ